ncbi:MAG: S41 family peptidase [Planctomycetota bacterium]
MPLSRRFSPPLLAASITASAAGFLLMGPPAGTAAYAADGQIDAAAGGDRLTVLAKEGRFDDLLDAIKADADRHHPEDADSLIQSLERYQQNEAERRLRRDAAFDGALADVVAEVAEDNLEDALVSAIEAHSVADAPLLVLRNPAVVDLVTRTEIAAKQAELDEDWVEAAVLFGRLNLLYEDDNRYREDVRRVSDHLRVLALYTPEVLRKLQDARAARVGNEGQLNPARPDDEESWQTRLDGINAEMLRESIKTAADRHIDHDGYAELLTGAIEPLLTLLDTPALSREFPGLADAHRAEAFRADLLRAKADLADPGLKLTPFRAMSRIDEVLANNRRTVKLPESVVAYEMTEGALGTLDDFSSMYWPEDIDFLMRSTQGAFFGIGVQIARRVAGEDNLGPDAGGDEPIAGARITVISPLAGSPAMALGIKAGDVIATVNGRDASHWSLTKAVREITGPEGTQVTLGIEREGQDELLEFVVTRGRIEIESVKGWAHTDDGGWDHWIDRGSGIGYIRLTQFIPQSVDKLDRAVADLRATGQLNGLILDLRHNPGGLLTSAIQIVNRFLDHGPILYTVDGDREIKSAWNARRRGTYADFPLVILINRGSASASEIVSGALQDRGRAFVVGDRSYGKGSVQDVYWFPSPPPRAKYGLKVTTQYYQLPKGRLIHRKPDSEVWGIDPDLAVDVTNQTVAWNLELRQEIDVLRDKGADTVETTMTKPWVRLAGLEPADPEADNAGDKVDVPLPTPDALLDLGLDPQLEAALLVLKTHQVVAATTVAQAAD